MKRDYLKMPTFRDPYVISDLHLHHKNMATYRGFESVEDHDNHIVECWNAVVKPPDQVLILGDLTLKRAADVHRLNGHKYLIMGNHDSWVTQKYLDSGFLKLYGALGLSYNEVQIILTHIPIHPNQFYRYNLNVHGHLHTKKVTNFLGFEDKRYFNVSCEPLNYKPKLLSEIVMERFKR